MDMLACCDRSGGKPNDDSILDDGLALGDVFRGRLMAKGDRLAQREPAPRTSFVNQRIDERDDIVRGVNLKRDS
jgi:hypothetical protein